MSMPVNNASAADAGTITIGGDLTVNRLAFGAMRLTGRGIWGEPDDLDEAKAVLRRAVDLGVTLIDTADSYGPDVSERLIAEALRPYPEDLVIATKGGLARPAPDEWTAASRPEQLRAACEGSLSRLGLEQIPLYQWHRPDPDVPLADSVGALVDLQRDGKIRHIGVSNVTVDQLRQIQALAKVVSVQNRYNLATRESDPVLDVCRDEGLAFFPWAPIHDFRDVPVVRDIAARDGITARQVVLAWLLRRSEVIVPIPGTSTRAHLEENIGAAAVTLSDEDVAALSSAVHAGPGSPE